MLAVGSHVKTQHNLSLRAQVSHNELCRGTLENGRENANYHTIQGLELKPWPHNSDRCLAANGESKRTCKLLNYWGSCRGYKTLNP